MLNLIMENRSGAPCVPALIVNADDFGLDAQRNAAIVRSFQNGWCSSATLMANMQGFDEACDLIQQHDLRDCVGVHLNLCEGEPLTDGIRRHPRFCDNEGRFRLQRNERVVCLSLMECHAVAAELREQIARLRARRIAITHVDSHKHLHEELGMLRVIVPLAGEAGIPFIRRLRNIGPGTSTLKAAYRVTLNSWLARQGLLRTRFYGSLDDFRHELAHGDAQQIQQSCEIMIHPTLDETGRVVDLLTGQPIEVLRGAGGNPLPIVSYCGRVPAEGSTPVRQLRIGAARDVRDCSQLSGTWS